MRRSEFFCSARIFRDIADHRRGAVSAPWWGIATSFRVASSSSSRGRFLRGLIRWMARATSSLPVPVSIPGLKPSHR